MTEIVVVPSERHVERLAREGTRAETRTSLRERLAAALLAERRFVPPREARFALGMALAEPKREGAQLDLFSPAADDPLLAQLRARGGPSWTRAVAALDEAISRARKRGVDARALEKNAARGPAAARARMIASAMRALDACLSRSGATDARLVGPLLAAAIADSDAEDVARIIGARSLRSRFILSWEIADTVWWRALDDKLAPRGGGARVVLPAYDRKIEGTRERDPLDMLADDVARDLDAAPETETIDVTKTLQQATVIAAADEVAQARGVAQVVVDALREGAAVERVVVACPTLDERSLAPLRRAFDDARVVYYEGRGAPPSRAPVVNAALSALEVATSLDRLAVARLLRSGYVAIESARDLARALESAPTAAGADAAARLVSTAGKYGEAAAQLTALLAGARAARTRGEHVRAARALFAALGIGARAGRGGLATFASDVVPAGVARAERLAIARDARAFAALEETLDAYERVAAEVGVLEGAVGAEVFRLEIESALDAAAARPGAGRAAAVRIARLADVAGDVTDLLVVLDANEGVLPREARQDGLLPAPPTRDLAAFAVAVADARRVVFAHLTADAAPSRVIPAGATRLELGAARRATSASVARRAARERTREDFFLDPSRRTSDLTGSLANGHDVIVAATRELPVTGLERFARCPFMGYANVVLGARDAPLPKELPDAREEGSAIHDVLAAAFTATRDLWPRRPRDARAIMDIGLAAADAVLAREPGHAKLRGVARLRARDAARAVLAHAVADETWDFALAEQPFGPGHEWPPLVLEDVALRGKMDRVDRSHDGSAVRVLDYKRGKSSARDMMSAVGETALQVPLYACLASRVLDLPATGAYVSTQAPEARPPRGTEERMRELVARTGRESEIERRALVVVRNVRSGRIAPLPADETECRTCPASGGCRKPRFAMKPDENIEEQA